MHGLGFLTAPILGDAEIEACLSESAFVAAMGAFEAALAASQAELGIVSVSGARAVQELVQKGLTLEASTLAQGVAEAGVPVPALLATMRADLSDEGREALHWGATSQDVVDTALCLLFRDALDVIEARLGRLIETLKTQSEQYSKTPMLARTRGQLATPITFGLRVATWARPLIELEAELPALRGRALRVQFGGASGSQSVVAPHGAAISAALAERLGLADAPPWFTDRSGMAALAAWLGRLVAALAKMGRDIVEMSRGEVAELRAGASGGSSTMPHKANPVTAEALITAHAAAQGHLSALGAAALHGEERDGGAWAVEWSALPALFKIAGAASRQAGTLAADLRPDAERMQTRIEETPAVWAEVATFALAEHLGREAAKTAVQQALSAPMPSVEEFAAALQITTGYDVSSALAMGQTNEPAQAVSSRIFALRER